MNRDIILIKVLSSMRSKYGIKAFLVFMLNVVRQEVAPYDRVIEGQLEDIVNAILSTDSRVFGEGIRASNEIVEERIGPEPQVSNDNRPRFANYQYLIIHIIAGLAAFSITFWLLMAYLSL